MRLRAFVLSVFLSASVSLFAQSNETKETIAYSNITEFGYFATSPRSFGFEATTVNGFSIHQQHCLGLGLGFGYILAFSEDYFLFHMPLFVNYRLYFKPEKSFSPHLNVALGGTMVENGGGLYSAFTMGFKSKKFSFSSGFSFMAINTEMESYVCYYDEWGYYQSYTKTFRKMRYPFGIVLKCGFTF